jgi:hypothetical protein
MKKLIAALAICVGTAAFANDTTQATEKVQKTEQKQAEKTRDASQVFTQKPGDSIKESQRDAEEGIDATQVGPKIAKKAKDVTGIQTESEGTFKAAQAFTLTGKIKDKTLEGVTIERPGLPAADLDIRDKTAVWLDGKKVNKDALPEGAQVRAKFQLEGQDIVAVELRATSMKSNLKTPADKSIKSNNINNDSTMHENTGGSGSVRDDLHKTGQDIKSGAKEMKNDAKDQANEAREDVNEPLR